MKREGWLGMLGGEGEEKRKQVSDHSQSSLDNGNDRLTKILSQKTVHSLSRVIKQRIFIKVF